MAHALLRAAPPLVPTPCSLLTCPSALRLLVALGMICGAALSAHEIGTTRVAVQFESAGTYRIDIVTDAASLLEKLSAAPPAGADPAALASLLQASDARFRGRVKVTFDGVEVRPQAAYSVAATTATVRLAGKIPPGAQRFAWQYAWTFASYALTLRNPSSPPVAEWLEGGQQSKPFPLAAPPPRVDRWEIIRRYLALGFTHILPGGLDHVLFVLGIYLLMGRARAVLWQLTAFTAAHSITLGLSLYGLVSVSPRIVEPMIALSIAYVAIENIFVSELKPWRVGLVFAFGLLHGMGFAGALRDVGLPRSEFLTALVTFNLGVEMGQLAVVGAAFLLVGCSCAQRGWYRSRVVVPASLAIAATAVYWTFQRLSL